MTERHSKNAPVRAVERSLDILEILREREGASLSTIADGLDLPKSTVHNHLKTLEEKQYIVQEDNQYQLGLRFLDYGEYVKTRKMVYEEACPVVEELADRTGERAQFIAQEYGHGVYVHIAEGERAVNTGTMIGQRGGARLHATAAGKAILAHLPDDQRRAALDKWGMPKITENTIQERDRLREEFETIRERGFAINDEEHIIGLRAVGVPVMGSDEEVVGALSVSAPTHRMHEQRLMSDLPELLLGVSNELELNITFSGSNVDT